MNILFEMITALLIVGCTSIGSMITLGASQLITTDDGDYHLEGVNYVFDKQSMKAAAFNGGLMGLVILYVVPYLFLGGPIIHWIPMAIISLASAQSLIDIKYHELANEWTLLIGILGVWWTAQNGMFSMTSVMMSAALYSLFFICWFIFDVPGYGDVKLALVAGIFLTTWIGLYQFILLSLVFAVVSEGLHVLINKGNAKQTLAFGPYMLFTLLLAMINII